MRGLGLEIAGVKLDDQGGIAVDEYSQTSVSHIYAIGDVTDRVNLTPVAIREGHAFADTVFGGKAVKVDHSNVPTAVFSEPEIGTIGLTEMQARERFTRVDIYKTTFRPMKATLSGRNTRAFLKLVVDGDTDRVVGCHIVGPRCRRIDPARRHRDQNGGDQSRFRRDHGGASDRGRGAGHHARKGRELRARRPKTRCGGCRGMALSAEGWPLKPPVVYKGARQSF